MKDCCSSVKISSRDGSVSSNLPILDTDCPSPEPCPPHHHHHKCPTNCDHQDYILSEGISVHLEPGKEINRDIVLEPNPYKECGTISGVIRDKHGCLIKNALVKVFDSNHHPVMHVFTNQEGQFLFCLAPGNYIIKAVR